MAKKKAKKAKSAGGGGGGFGAKPTAVAGPTAAQLLKQSMAVYDQIERSRRQHQFEAASDDDDDAEEGSGSDAAQAEPKSSVTKYCVTVKGASSSEFADWVPVALLAFQCGRDGKQDELVPSAIGASCRELLEAGCSVYPALRKVSRDTIEYSYEPLDSFEAHVWDGLVGRGGRRADALATLGLDAGASASDVKRAHRRAMMDLHPDSFVGAPEGEAEAAKERMLEVQAAYTELGGGQGSASESWYEAVGGKSRVSFSGKLRRAELGPLGKARAEQGAAFEAGGWLAGVYPMDPDVTREFVTRNIARASAAQAA